MPSTGDLSQSLPLSSNQTTPGSSDTDIIPGFTKAQIVAMAAQLHRVIYGGFERSEEKDLPFMPMVKFLTQTIEFLKATFTGCPPAPNANNVVYEFFSAIHEIEVQRISGNWVPSLPSKCSSCAQTVKRLVVPRPKREDRVIRKNILTEAAAKYTTSKKGKPWGEPRVLSAYGRRDIKLDGKEASVREMDPEDACFECQTLKPLRRCIMVEPDKFWHRAQCVECVARKISCSIPRDRVSKSKTLDSPERDGVSRTRD